MSKITPLQITKRLIGDDNPIYPGTPDGYDLIVIECGNDTIRISELDFYRELVNNMAVLEYANSVDTIVKILKRKVDKT